MNPDRQLKALVCNSPITEEPIPNFEKALPPLGLGYICSSIKKSGNSVEFLDAYNLNISAQEVIERVTTANPDFLIINIFSINKYVVFKILKGLPSHIGIILGGGVRGIDFSELSIENDVIVIEGEGEVLIPRLLSGEGKRENKFTKFLVNKESEFYPENLSDVVLDHNFFVNDPQPNKFGKMESYLLYSRGCIYSCTFCGSSMRMKRLQRRVRTPESLKAEMETLSPNTEHIRFLDDLLIDNSNDIENLTSVMAETGMSWSGMISVLSVKKASDEELQKMYQSGCSELFLGIESGSEKTLKLFKKHYDIEDIVYQLTRLLEIGFNIKVFLILGTYNEELEDLQKTLNFAKRIASLNLKGRVRFSPFMYKAYEGTELYNKIANENPEKFQETNRNEGIKTESNDRSQFNNSNGNFSNCSVDQINKHINAILELNNIE